METPVKKGYSIWSLLVIMTLLAVWLAVPRRVIVSQTPLLIMLFFVSHQLTLWGLIGVAAWLLLGKRELVKLIFVSLIVLMWTPITLVVIQMAITGNQVNVIRCISASSFSRFMIPPFLKLC